ncbi:Hemerythrin-like protein [Magnetospirillum sp. LM-5]|uniref:bacteriohemerythrin n=1 Tax=Magnetospirillum sp. LM-5 TaxID=2681466 RepID=UPI00138154BA|nr:hemerythrin family protein [Magnetospirillum sp. LM-5]CAA7621315.1 Hemerythrin-like protein [Magnetospirillum sp. LM-5]
MLAWENGYKIGHDDMDAQHLILFALLNQLDVNINADLADECVQDVLGALSAYIEYHFAHEEALMNAVGYPGLEGHAALHREFVAKVEELRTQAEDGNKQRAALKIRGFVLDWLLGHILEVDNEYSRYIAAKHNKA